MKTSRFGSLVAMGVAAGAAMLMTGCASTGGNPVVEWQNNRFMAAEIKAAKANNPSGKVESKDLVYTSVQGEKFKAFGVPFTALGLLTGEVYMPVVNGVDEKAIMESGRELAIDFNRMTKESAEDRMTPEQVFEEWAKSDKEGAKPKKEVYDEYMKYVARVENDGAIAQAKDIIERQIPELVQKLNEVLQNALEDVQNNPPTDASAMEIMGALGKAKDDAAALGAELADTGVGAKLWLEILMDEKAMQEQMKSVSNIK